MTIVFLQPDGVPITAQAERQGSAALYGAGSARQLGGRSGFRVGTPADTLTATSTVWTLKPCAAQIDPGAATHQGMYGWASDANITGDVTASDATYARKDIVYVQVNDSSSGDGSGATTANVSYLAGVATATPAAPALPARSFLLGTIDVPKTGAGSPTATVNPARFVAAGGVLPVASVAERDALTKSVGLAVTTAELNGLVEVWNGTEWRSPRKRRRAEFTASASPVGGAAWGLSTPVEVVAASNNNSFATPGGDSRITFSEAGDYAITMKLSSNSAPGFFYASIKNSANTDAYADNTNGGGPDWGVTVPLPTLHIPVAGTGILFGLRTGNTTGVTAKITIVKIGD